MATDLRPKTQTKYNNTIYPFVDDDFGETSSPEPFNTFFAAGLLANRQMTQKHNAKTLRCYMVVKYTLHQLRWPFIGSKNTKESSGSIASSRSSCTKEDPFGMLGFIVDISYR